MLLLFLTILLKIVINQSAEQCYGVLFDAGSSSTKISIFQFSCRDK